RPVQSAWWRERWREPERGYRARVGASVGAHTKFGGSRDCRRGDSNPYTFRYWLLRPARLPIPPLLRGANSIRRAAGSEVNLSRAWPRRSQPIVVARVLTSGGGRVSSTP